MLDPGQRRGDDGRAATHPRATGDQRRHLTLNQSDGRLNRQPNR